MSNAKVPQSRRKVAATRCSHCNHVLTTGEGIDVPFIGPLGPECVQKYAGLIAVLEEVQKLEAQEWDRDTWALPVWVHAKLRGLGLSVAFVEEEPGIKRLKITDDLRRGKPGRAGRFLAKFEEVRAEFEQRLQLAGAAAEAAEVEKEIPAAPEAEPDTNRPALIAPLLDILHDEGIEVDEYGEQRISLLEGWEEQAQRVRTAAERLGLQVQGVVDVTRQEYRLWIAGAA